MKRYTGRRTEAGCVVLVVEDGEERQLDPRLDLRNHSPDGLEWGYAGSGPAQLALAILADHLRTTTDVLAVPRAPDHADRLAERWHQDFKRTAIAPLEGDTWTMTAEDVELSFLSSLPPGTNLDADESPLPGDDEDDELADDTEADARAHADIMRDAGDAEA